VSFVSRVLKNDVKVLKIVTKRLIKSLLFRETIKVGYLMVRSMFCLAQT